MAAGDHLHAILLFLHFCAYRRTLYKTGYNQSLLQKISKFLNNILSSTRRILYNGIFASTSPFQWCGRLLNLLLNTFLQAADNIGLVGTQTADGCKVLAKIFANSSSEWCSDGPLAVISKFSKVQVSFEEDELGVVCHIIKQLWGFLRKMSVCQSGAPELVRCDNPLTVLNVILPTGGKVLQSRHIIFAR